MRSKGTITRDGYVAISVNNKVYSEHVLIAERALGRKLSPKTQVHHVDGDRSNNDHTNLIICQDQKYHRLIHKLTEKVKPRWDYMDYRAERYYTENYKARREKPAIILQSIAEQCSRFVLRLASKNMRYKPDQNIIPKAAIILQELAEKSHEQIHFTDDAVPILFDLEQRGMIHRTTISSISEQNIWTITAFGANWLRRHGL